MDQHWFRVAAIVTVTVKVRVLVYEIEISLFGMTLRVKRKKNEKIIFNSKKEKRRTKPQQ